MKFACVAVNYGRAYEDSDYCRLIIEDLERDICSGDIIDPDRLLKVFCLMRYLNDFVDVHADECEDCRSKCPVENHRCGYY